MNTHDLLMKYLAFGSYKGVEGWFGYKVFRTKRYGTHYPMPDHWKLRQGQVLTMGSHEKFDRNPEDTCSHGIYCMGAGKLLGDTFTMVYQVWEVFLPKANLKNTLAFSDYLCGMKVRATALRLVRSVPIRKIVGGPGELQHNKKHGVLRFTAAGKKKQMKPGTFTIR
jgi:hypothetical protein